jgi:hypothetical protein
MIEIEAARRHSSFPATDGRDPDSERSGKLRLRHVQLDSGCGEALTQRALRSFRDVESLGARGVTWHEDNILCDR